MRAPKIFALVVLLAGGAVVAAAQGPDPAVIKDSIGASMMRVRKFQWIQTMTLAVDGETKQTSVSSCRYAPESPKPACTEISSTPAEKPSGGPFRKRKMEAAISEMKAYMDSVKTLIGEYVPPRQEKIAAAMQVGNVATAPNPSMGSVSLIVSNYTQQGDKMTFVVGAKDSQLRSVSIATWLNDPAAVVTLNVTYAALNDGTHYAQRTVLNASAKKIMIIVTTTNYSVAM